MSKKNVIISSVMLVLLICAIVAYKTDRENSREHEYTPTVTRSVTRTTPIPSPSATPQPVWTPTSTGRTRNEDEYNASDYSNPDDFYEDHYDDFYDYYDAEDYWYEYGDD